MCDRSLYVNVKVKIPADLRGDGVAIEKETKIDSCVAPIVAALQTAGIDMRGSCCGHGKDDGHIDLQDGRGLVILSPERNQQYLAATRRPFVIWLERQRGGAHDEGLRRE